jgi:hypothetical protein
MHQSLHYIVDPNVRACLNAGGVGVISPFVPEMCFLTTLLCVCCENGAFRTLRCTRVGGFIRAFNCANDAAAAAASLVVNIGVDIIGVVVVVDVVIIVAGGSVKAPKLPSPSPPSLVPNSSS